MAKAITTTVKRVSKRCDLCNGYGKRRILTTVRSKALPLGEKRMINRKCKRCGGTGELLVEEWLW